ncbi:uncharacterized protein LOC142609154 [Castanea sativa]|uniref:uncharacterized protein LOC142609154 n=1 Tax=Castanea sativa TaxID=21020 RepID=UPI003F64A25F
MFAHQIGRNVEVYMNDMLVKSIQEDGTQKPVYFTSQALRGAEERYPPMEKLAFALVTATHKLKPYFQAHTIVVLTEKSLRRAMSSPEATGRMALWVIELNEQEAEGNPQWVIYTNRSAVKHAGGAGIVLLSPEGDKVQCMIRLNFPITNNKAEYKALTTGLDLAQATGATNAMIRCDSQVVTIQITSCYECRGEQMKKYLEHVKGRMRNMKIEFV